jgi:hypothetical protein
LPRLFLGLRRQRGLADEERMNQIAMPIMKAMPAMLMRP